MNGDMEQEIFDTITTDECCEANCEYQLVVGNPHGITDYTYTHYECGGNISQCPILPAKVLSYLEGE